MSNRRVVGLGLLAGSATTAVLVAAVVAFGPEVALVPPTPSPPAVPAASGTLVPSPVASPSGSAAAASSTPVASLPSASAGSSPVPSGAGPGGSPSPAASGAAGSSSPDIGSLFHIGRPAPPLVVPQIGGGQIDLAVLRGHAVWIEFMATWCPSCRDEFPLMNGFAARYASDGLVILAIDVKEDEGAVAAFANALSAGFPVGVDGDGAAAKAWGVAALPVHFFVDSTGVVRDGAIGGIGPDLMAASLRKILPGVAVTP